MRTDPRKWRISIDRDQIAMLAIDGRSIGFQQESIGTFDWACPASWSPTLEDMMQQAGLKQASAHLTLGDGLVHCFVATLPDGLRNVNELERYLAARLEALLGVTAEDWKIAFNPDARGQRMLVCACERSPLENLETLLLGRQCRLASCQPFWMREFSARRKLLPESGVWFAAVGRQDVSLIGHDARNFIEYQTARLGDSTSTVASLLQRCRLTHGETQARYPVWVSGITPPSDLEGCWDGLLRFVPATDNPHFKDSEKSRYRMALAGVDR